MSTSSADNCAVPFVDPKVAGSNLESGNFFVYFYIMIKRMSIYEKATCGTINGRRFDNEGGSSFFKVIIFLLSRLFPYRQKCMRKIARTVYKSDICKKM